MAKKGLGKGLNSLFNEEDIEEVTSDITKSSEGDIKKVRMSLIEPNKKQPRRHFDEEKITALADSIKEHGLIQPIIITPSDNNMYKIVAGERRWRAAKKANLKEIPAVIRKYSEEQVAEIALIENLQREDLHFLEEAEGYEKLMEEFHLTQEAMAARVGKKQSTIANKLRLLRLSDRIRKILVEGGLTERHARALLKLDDEEKQVQVLTVVIDNGYSVRQTESYIEKLLEDKKQEKKKRMVIVNDVRIYLNSIKQVVSAIKDVGIPVAMEQTVEGDDVIVSLRIKNMKKPKGGNAKPLF